MSDTAVVQALDQVAAGLFGRADPDIAFGTWLELGRDPGGGDVEAVDDVIGKEAEEDPLHSNMNTRS